MNSNTLKTMIALEEQHAERPPTLEVGNTPGSYLSRAQECTAFHFLTDELTSQYIIGELLGHGGGGDVYAGVRIADGAEVAIKFPVIDGFLGMMTIPGETNLIPIEVGLMKMVSKPVCDPNVLELLEWLIIPGFMVLILEKPSPCIDLVEFCQLHGGKLPEPLARDIMIQLVLAARHCCDRGVFHNDIKPGNILINTQTLQIKLIDFGYGDLLMDTPYKHCPGTREYFPPEWCRHKQYLGRPATVWTLGIVLYEMICGDVPFHTMEEITTGPLHFPPGLSQDCCNLISTCLVQEPESRPTFRQILKHQWLRKTYIKKLTIIGGLKKRLTQFRPKKITDKKKNQFYLKCTNF